MFQNKVNNKDICKNDIQKVKYYEKHKKPRGHLRLFAFICVFFFFFSSEITIKTYTKMIFKKLNITRNIKSLTAICAYSRLLAFSFYFSFFLQKQQ